MEDRPPKTSPHSSSSSSCSSNGAHHPSPRTSPNKAKASADPTTFIQADTSSFKQLVQMLTGSSQTTKHARSPTKSSIPPVGGVPKKPGHKLYERRGSFKDHLRVSPLVSGLSPDMLSPSTLDFPSLVISPVTPLSLEPFSRSPGASYATSKLSSEQGKTIVDSGFYLDYSSSSSTPRDAEPRLLPLFPVTSPKISGAGSF